MKFKLPSLLVLAVIYSCNTQLATLIKVEGYTQGTTYHITYASSDSIPYRFEIDSLLKDFDNSLSTYDPSSLISKLNHSMEAIEMDKQMAYLFKQSRMLNRETNGAFDITIGPILVAYGFGKNKKHILQPEVIDSIMQYVGMENLLIEGNTVQRKSAGVELNVNAIAQGYSVDLVGEFLESKGIENYLVEIGGEVMAKGTKNGKPWRVGIDKPIENNFNPGANLQAVVELQDKALATSGNYRNYFELDGKKIVHIINPKTGYSNPQNLLSATVITTDCTTADAYATACMVIGLEESIKLIESKTGIDAYLIFSNSHGEYEIYQSSGLSEIIKEMN